MLACHTRAYNNCNTNEPLPRRSTMAKKISQFAMDVVNFSSQYGTQGSRTYTACNLAGGLNVYDDYGDRTEAFVLVSFFRQCLWVYFVHLPFSVPMDCGGTLVCRHLGL